MDHIEVTRRDEGKFARILVSKKHVISAMPYRNGDIEGTYLEIDNINGINSL